MSDYVDWPGDLCPYVEGFYLQPYTGGAESPFSRTTKVYGLAKPRWVCRISLRAPEGFNNRWGPSRFYSWGERIDAFLASIEGRLKRVRLFDFRRPGGNWAFSNAAAVKGSSTITLTGAQDGDIRVGEYLGGDGRPHIITALNVSGSDLIATIKPPLERDIAAGAARFERVGGYFRVTDDDAGNNLTQVGELTHYDLEFVEYPMPGDGIPENVTYGPDVTFGGAVVTY